MGTTRTEAGILVRLEKNSPLKEEGYFFILIRDGGAKMVFIHISIMNKNNGEKSMPSAATSGNLLFYGDNLEILREYIKDESVDLIYLDPPFNSNANYNVLFAEHSGSKSSAQIQAFEDTWSWGEDSEQAYRETAFQKAERVKKSEGMQQSFNLDL